jgi:hypothetical protein
VPIQENDLAAGSLRNLLWHLAIIVGWVAVISLGYGWYARRRFRAFLKVPLTEEVEHLTHIWERRVTHWTAAGLALSSLSIICLVFWLSAGMIP